MRRFLGALLHFIARAIAAFFAVLFVIVTVPVLVLFNVDQTLLNARTYERAFAEQRIYERAPQLIADQLGAMETFLADPCAENPLACRIDGAPPELQTCLTQALGEDPYIAIGSGRRAPSEAELQLAQPCLEQFAAWPGGENPLPGASPKVLACVQRSIGEQAYEALLADQRPPTEAEARSVEPCLAQDDENSQDGGADAGRMGFLNNLTQEDRQTLIRTLLPPDLMQSMTDDALEEVFAYLHGERDTAGVSLVRFRERLVGETGREVIELLVAAQPPCTAEQLAAMTASLSGGEGEMDLCRPPEDRYETMLSGLQSKLSTVAGDLPDEAVILKPPSEIAAAAEGGPFGLDPLSALRYLLLGFRFSPLLPLGILILVAIFGVRSLKGWLRWWGIPMLIAGLIAFGLGLAPLLGLDWFWVNQVQANIPSYFSPAMAEVARGLLDSLVRQLSIAIMLESAALSLMGVAGILVSRRVQTKPKEAPPQQELA